MLQIVWSTTYVVKVTDAQVRALLVEHDVDASEVAAADSERLVELVKDVSSELESWLAERESDVVGVILDQRAVDHVMTLPTRPDSGQEAVT